MKNVWPKVSLARGTATTDPLAAIAKIVDANRDECAGCKVTAFNEIAYLLEHPAKEGS